MTLLVLPVLLLEPSLVWGEQGLTCCVGRSGVVLLAVSPEQPQSSGEE
jgi:hypothetical protein